jgi:DNA-binding transcriptional MerR regulator
MNNFIKTSFTIKDLENLSGIKTHTIRMWERRHQILVPMRTHSNIRYYDSSSLQRLLNVKLLNEHGYKLSTITKLDENSIAALIRQIVSEKSAKFHAISNFKLAMMNFDQPLFFSTYNSLLAEKSFREVFNEVFMPLMEELGFLWQTNTITPAHEHFVSYLLRQKILTNTERLQILEPTRNDKVFVLFLPKNEIHDVGLLYANYEITLHGYRSIYLGESVPIESLRDFRSRFEKVVYVSYLTVAPHEDELNDYLSQFADEIMDGTSEFWLLGRRAKSISGPIPKRIQVFSDLPSLINEL